MKRGCLVAFHLRGQMSSAGGDLVGVRGLGLQGIGDEQDPGQSAEHLLDRSSSGANDVGSLLFVSTVTSASTIPVAVSSADNRWT